MTCLARVVVTGLGAVTPLGLTVDATWHGLVSGRNGFGPPVLDGVSFRTGCFARVPRDPGWDAEKWRSTDDVARYALVAAREAWRGAGLPQAGADLGRRMGCIMGTGAGGERTHDLALRDIYRDGRERLHPATLPSVMVSGAGSRISMELGLRGLNFTVSSACASGLHAVALAARLIEDGEADVVVAGGAEAPFALGALRSWEALRVLSPTTCRPFSAERDGMTLGEGAAILVLESEEHAVARGASVLARVSGIGMSSDASSMVAPCPGGMAAAMTSALHGAIYPNGADVLVAHGTGTFANDQCELDAIAMCFDNMPTLCALKGAVGHMLGAAGALNAVVASLLVGGAGVPVASNPLSGTTLDDGTSHRVRAALANAFAFGGLNVSVLFTSYKDQAGE